MKEIHPCIVSVKPYMRDGQLCADIYVKDSEAPSDPGEWDRLVDDLNSNISRYERIQQYNIYSSTRLLK